MGDERLFETREGFFRSFGVILAGLFFFVPTLIAAAIDGNLVLLGILGVLWLGTIIRVPRRTLRFYADRMEISGLLGPRRIPYGEVTGVTTRWLVLGHQERWTDLLVLRTRQGKVHLHAFEDGDGIWNMLQELVWPRLAEALAERADRGEAVRLGPTTIERDGFLVRGGSYWWDELDSVTLTKDGLLLTILDRPHEARVFRPSGAAEAFLLPWVCDRMLERAEALEPEARLARGRRGPVQERPLAGLPSAHPELGEILFTRTVPLWAKLLIGALGLGLLLLVLGGVGWGLGLHDTFALEDGVLMAPGGALLVLGIMLFGVTDPPSGDEFTVYEGGFADTQRTLPWDRVETLTLGATEHYTNGIYSYTAYSARAEGGGEGFGLSGFGARTQAYWDWFRDRLAPILAQRDVARMAEGETVDYGFASLDNDGIHWAGGSLPWESYHSKNASEGTLYLFSHEAEQSVHSVALKEPNAHVFQLILDVMEHEAHEDLDE